VKLPRNHGYSQYTTCMQYGDNIAIKEAITDAVL